MGFAGMNNNANNLPMMGGMLVGGVVGAIIGIGIWGVLVMIVLFVYSGLQHLALKMFGGAKQGFEATFRSTAYTLGAAMPLVMIPFCGGLIHAVVFLVFACNGLARLHEISMGKSIGTVIVGIVLPSVVCCGGYLYVVFMMLGAMANN